MEDRPGRPQTESRMWKIPGAEYYSRIDAWWWLVVVVVGLVALLTLSQPDPYMRIFRFVLDGLGITVFVTLVSFVFILVLGLIGGLGRLSKNRAVYGITSLYVEIIRGIPLLVQLIWWYFAFPVVIQQLGKAINFAPMVNYQANAIL